jgi:hypothetical protein
MSCCSASFPEALRHTLSLSQLASLRPRSRDSSCLSLPRNNSHRVCLAASSEHVLWGLMANKASAACLLYSSEHVLGASCWMSLRPQACYATAPQRVCFTCFSVLLQGLFAVHQWPCARAFFNFFFINFWHRHRGCLRDTSGSCLCSVFNHLFFLFLFIFYFLIALLALPHYCRGCWRCTSGSCVCECIPSVATLFLLRRYVDTYSVASE